MIDKIRSLKNRFVDPKLSSSNHLLGDRDIEWSWIAANMPQGPGKVLDFGNGGGPLGLMAALCGLTVTSIDLNDVDWPYEHPLLSFRKGDVLKLDLPAESFDVVINCSTIEHVGLAGRYNIVKHESDGDLSAMKRIYGLMRPGGIMILTLPIGQDYTAGYLHRIYGKDRLPKLLEGYTVVKESYWTKRDLQKWVPADRENALSYKIPEYNKPGDPIIYNLGCFVLRK